MEEQTQQLPWLVNNILFCYDEVKNKGNNREKKQYFLQHKENHSNNKETYTDRSKSTGRKVVFTAVFADITRREALPEKASIHTTMREIKKREDMKWVKYTDSLSSMLAIENNKENHPILNLIYDILTELHN